MTELGNVHTVVDVETILELVHRVCQQGSVMVNCTYCVKTPQPSIVTLPALSEQCLALFEVVCAAYDISTQPALFDPSVLAFEQPPGPFVCIRSKVVLGQTELDEDEAQLLVRTLLGRTLMRLVELMEGLKEIVRVLLESAQHSRTCTAALRACEASLECTIGRLTVFMQQIDVECSGLA
ncbi:hypothetical protein N7510_001646 [Penicillium lagena]|uniref:uncharacterized protein n=1 Tax=Penicillium lagena TaxID=94218 RepID=UPI00253FD2C8|nr:uncharacterized protein N7510_001646 [Penicillium lagena]KAJ5625337.1 hypothetical protein N7510_001646 [Penicillium lagena]